MFERASFNSRFGPAELFQALAAFVPLGEGERADVAVLVESQAGPDLAPEHDVLGNSLKRDYICRCYEFPAYLLAIVIYKLFLLFQRPIEGSDVKDGKLVPTAWSKVNRRGGKRQTGLTLSFESAETLHAVLGEAIKDAKAKQRRKAYSEQALNFFLSYVAEQDALSTVK